MGSDAGDCCPEEGAEDGVGCWLFVGVGGVLFEEVFEDGEPVEGDGEEFGCAGGIFGGHGWWVGGVFGVAGEEGLG